MQNIKKIIFCVKVMAVSLLIVVISSCGGASINWDEFSPRTAVVSDFASKSFGFDWIPTDNSIKAGLGPCSIKFGAFTDSVNGTFEITNLSGGKAKGTCTFNAPNLTFTVTEIDGTANLTVGYVVINKIEADTSDGRIRLTNTGTSVNMTSNP